MKKEKKISAADGYAEYKRIGEEIDKLYKERTALLDRFGKQEVKFKPGDIISTRDLEINKLSYWMVVENSACYSDVTKLLVATIRVRQCTKAGCLRSHSVRRLSEDHVKTALMVQKATCR